MAVAAPAAPVSDVDVTSDLAQTAGEAHKTKGNLMTLPHSYGMVLMLTILTMICWGSWTNVLKFTKGWRFELLYYDYSIGAALGAALAGLTFGTWGSDGQRFIGDLSHAGSINILSAFAGGVIFNLSNILVVGAISVAGMGVGFPIGVGLALVVGVIWNYIVNPQGGHVVLIFIPPSNNSQVTGKIFDQILSTFKFTN